MIPEKVPIYCLRPYCKNEVNYDTDFPLETLVTCDNMCCLLHMKRLCEKYPSIAPLTSSYKNYIMHNNTCDRNLEEIIAVVSDLIQR